MKTDRFDDEFRRKLLGLPADTDPGEVDRIHTYVKTHEPGIFGSFWGKLGLIGGTGLLLVASLTYNFIQLYRNTHLQVSIDSLTQKSQLATNRVKHDTLYVIRQPNAKINTNFPPQSVAAESAGNKPDDRLVSQQSKANPALNATQELIDRVERQWGEPSRQPLLPGQRNGLATETDSSHVALSPVHETAAPGETSTNPAGIEAKARLGRKKGFIDPLIIAPNSVSHRSTELATRSIKSGSVKPSTEVGGRLPARRLVSVTQAYGSDQPENVVAASKRTGRLVATKNSDKTNIFRDETISVESVSGSNRQTTRFESLISRKLSIVSPFSQTLPVRRPLVLPGNQLSAQKTRQRWHLTLPTLSVPNPTYRIGTGLTVGLEDQLSGSLLGELALNRHWSIQTGVRMLSTQGFHYRNEHDFDDHQDEDFRHTYAPQLSQTADIEDITLESTIVQVPIQIGYHYPLNQQWSLRLGIGTDLDVWTRSSINYKYGENNRQSERGLARVKNPVSVLNNLTLTPSIEWYRKKWIVRAGPFISPQLRPVSYKPDDLSWGANVQVFYRFGN